MHSCYKNILIIPVLLLLYACSLSSYFTDDTNKQVPVTINLHADAWINPNEEGMACPLVVNIYVLKNTNQFNTSSFFNLYQSPKSVLGEDLITFTQVVMQPNSKQKIKSIQMMNGQYLGIVAAYQNIDKAEWRKLIPAKKLSEKEVIKIELTRLAIKKGK